MDILPEIVEVMYNVINVKVRIILPRIVDLNVLNAIDLDIKLMNVESEIINNNKIIIKDRIVVDTIMMKHLTNI